MPTVILWTQKATFSKALASFPGSSRSSIQAHRGPASKELTSSVLLQSLPIILVRRRREKQFPVS